MSWLFPLYLAGAAAIIAPILLHLRRQPPKDRVTFSSLMFLEQTERQPTRRRRLENWLLLVARCLILILLALMFARPFSRSSEATAAAAGESVVVLVDKSASMRRGDLWKQAVAVARDEVGKTGAEDRVAVGVFDAEVEWPLAGADELPEARRVAVTTGLEKAQPGWGRTDLGRALVAGLDVFGQWDTGEGGRRRLVVVSDFQEGAQVSALQKVAWPQGVTLERKVVSLEETDPGNLTIELVSGRTEEEAETDEVATTAQTEAVRRVRVSSTRESQQTAFSLAWAGAEGGATVQGYLPPGGRRVLKMPPRAEGDATPGTLVLSGDGHDFDNRVHVTPEQPREVRVRVAAEGAGKLEQAASPGYYLKRALQPTAAIRPVLETVDAAGWAQVSGAGVLVSAGDGVRLGAGGIAAWQKALEQGGLGIYVVEGPAATAELKALTGGMDWTLKEAERAGGESYAMLGELDAKDVLLAPFADARLRDFTKVRFWRHRVVTVPEAEGVKVLAKFDNGDAAMMAVRQGAGTLLVLAAGWHPADSQLALSTKFVPLWFGWLAAAGYAHEEAAALEAGQALPWVLKADGEVTEPNGKVSVLNAGDAYVAKEPGVYRVAQGGAAADSETRWFAVQLPVGEGRVSVMPEERLAELGVNLAAVNPDEVAQLEMSEEARQRLDGVETEAKQRLWLWTLIGILVLVAVETLLSARRVRETAVA